MTLTVKQFIFASKYKNVPKLSTLMLKRTFTDIRIEKLMLLKNCKFAEDEKHWQTICNMLCCLSVYTLVYTCACLSTVCNCVYISVLNEVKIEYVMCMHCNVL